MKRIGIIGEGSGTDHVECYLRYFTIVSDLGNKKREGEGGALHSYIGRTTPASGFLAEIILAVKIRRRLSVAS
jgi:hypothetical protein